MKSKTKGRATTNNEKILLYVLGLLAICTICYILIIYPASNKLSGVKSEISSLESQLVDVGSVDYDIEQRKKELNSLMTKYQEATITLPKKDDSDKLMSSMLKIMDDLAISKNTINTAGSHDEPEILVVTGDGQEASSLSGMRVTKFTYNIEADLGKLNQFIDRIENFERIAEIKEFTWNIKNSETKDTAKITFSFYDTGEE